MKFLKNYMPLMLKLFGTQIIISMLSSMLYVTLYDIPALLAVGTALALAIYLYMQFRTVWEHACFESMKEASAQIHIGPVTGLLVGLGSGVPAFVFNLVPVVSPMHVNEFGELGGLSNLFYIISKFFFNGQYVSIIQSFFPLKTFDTQNTALAIQNAKNILSSLPCYLLTILPVGLVCWFGYWLGLKDRTLLSWLGLDKLFGTKKKTAKK